MREAPRPRAQAPAIVPPDGSTGSDAVWWAAPVEDVVARVVGDPALGLARDDAVRRLARDGRNELERGGRLSIWGLMAAQFRSLLVWILLGAALVSMALGERADSLAIVAIVILNAAIGFLQEYRADRAAAALARMTAPRARVVRGGQAEVIPAAEAVVGDLLLLEAGDLVAADARLLDASALRVNEAPLTGESEPVDKRAGTCPAGAPVADRFNMVFLGTSVVGGSGRGLVVGTGMRTEVGHIAELLRTAESGATPVARRLDQVGHRLMWACAGIVALVVVLGWWRGVPVFELFLGAISLAVAAIPEGLPAVVTVALALGVRRMARRRALVRHLPAVETLGCAEVVCTDKTGTLTRGEMTARKVVTGAAAYSLASAGDAGHGAFVSDGAPGAASTDPALLDLVRAAAACNDAELAREDGALIVVGDPTEGALLVAAARAGMRRQDIEVEMPRLATIPFDPDRKRMTVIRQRAGRPWAFVKGAPEAVIGRCTRRRTDGVAPMTDRDRDEMLRAGAALAGAALRVLAVAERPLDRSGGSADLVADEVEGDLIFLGLVGLQDPPRPEARGAVARCRAAGIRTVMITGDHPDTARAIARELGMLDAGDELAVGAELERMSDQELGARVERTAVYARVTAEHKLRIVRAWKARGAVVAMTGDGINDAPALREASIGVAMGLTGTEVTKEAADLIIADDNFASIVAAVEEGRGVYDNIAKALAYLLAGNAAELAVMLVAAVVGWPLPLLPLHLLWINLVTDGLPALALATDRPDPDVLDRPPRRPETALLDVGMLRHTALVGGLTAFATLGAFGWEWLVDADLRHARDAAFTVLVMAELLRALGARSRTRPIWQMGWRSSLRLVVVVAAGFAIQLAIHHVPAAQALFGIAPVSLAQCVGWSAVAAGPLLLLEIGKALRGLQSGPSSRSTAGRAWRGGTP
jgi:Ca2+-transporting ATPase